MSPLVTIVIPFLNRADTLPRLLTSLRGVTYAPLELILVDNGSTDASAAICRSFISAFHTASPTHSTAPATQSSAPSTQSSAMAVHSPAPATAPAISCRLIECSVPGAAAARNAGLEQARGEYISFFDSDDEMSPSFIADMTALLDSATTPSTSRPELAVARTRSVWPDGSTRVRPQGGHDVKAHIIAQGLNTASWLARTELVRRVGGWNSDLRYWDDYELGVRLLLASRHTVWTERVYHRTYEHPGERLTNTTGPLRLERTVQALAAIERDLRLACTLNPSLTSRQLRSMRRALNLRTAIVCGQLRREINCLPCGAASAVIATSPGASSGTLHPTLRSRGLIARMLRLYTRAGGRGAWRMALFIIRFLHIL